MYMDSGPLFTKGTDVLPQDVVKSRTREIDCYNDHISLKFTCPHVTTSLIGWAQYMGLPVWSAKGDKTL